MSSVHIVSLTENVRFISTLVTAYITQSYVRIYVTSHEYYWRWQRWLALCGDCGLSCCCTAFYM